MNWLLDIGFALTIIYLVNLYRKTANKTVHDALMLGLVVLAWKVLGRIVDLEYIVIIPSIRTAYGYVYVVIGLILLVAWAIKLIRVLPLIER